MASRSNRTGGGARRCAAGLPLLALLLALPVPAAVFRNASYGEPGSGEPAARLVDVYTPESPGPHPVVLLLHGASDKSAATAWPVRLAGRDYVVYNANHRAGMDDALADVAEALRFVGRSASGYGGDSRRVYLMGVGADARLAARAALEAASGADAPGLPAGTILVGDPGPWPGGRAGGPALLVRSQAEAGARRATEAWAAQLQRQGLSAQVVAIDGSVAAPPATGATIVDVVDAWLSASEIPRVQRFENLGFAPAVVPGLAPVQAFAVDADAIHAAAGSQTWRRTSAAGAWTREHEHGAPVACLQQWSGQLHAVLASAEGLATSTRDGQGRWSEPVLRVKRQGADPARPHCLPDPAGGAWIGDGRQLWHFGPGRSARRVVALDSAISGMARVGGALVLAVEAGATLGAALWRVDAAGTASRVLVLPSGRAAWRHLLAVPDPEGSAREVLLGAEGGRIHRYDLDAGHAPFEELDLDSALRAQWGGLADRVPPRLSSDFAALAHPETGDRLHVAGLDARPAPGAEPGARGAWYLVRDLEGRYALGQAGDSPPGWPPAGAAPTIRDVVASPFVADGGAVLWFGGGDPGWLASGQLARAGPWPGLWWDPAHPGHGLLLQRAGGRWLALLYTYDADGEPAWYRTGLQVEGTDLASDAAGLVAQRAPDPGSAAQALATIGRLVLRFAPEAVAAACTETVVHDEFPLRAVLALDLAGRKSEWCLRPFRFAPPGLPGVAPRGLYGADSGDARWGLMVDTQGVGAAARSLAILFYLDRAGQPRWVMGTGASRHGVSELELQRHRGSCIGCGGRPARAGAAGSLLLRFAGYCGELRGAASLQLLQDGAAPLLSLRDAALAPAAEAACY